MARFFISSPLGRRFRLTSPFVGRFFVSGRPITATPGSSRWSRIDSRWSLDAFGRYQKKVFDSKSSCPSKKKGVWLCDFQRGNDNMSCHSNANHEGNEHDEGEKGEDGDECDECIQCANAMTATMATKAPKVMHQ